MPVKERGAQNRCCAGNFPVGKHGTEGLVTRDKRQMKAPSATATARSSEDLGGGGQQQMEGAVIGKHYKPKVKFPEASKQCRGGGAQKATPCNLAEPATQDHVTPWIPH